MPHQGFTPLLNGSQVRPGEAFILLNDHDPKPLYYQFLHERQGQVTWEYLEEGPEVWRVLIGKAGG
ncbi:DUF2249 domain-containing protein [Candidatus Methylacidithermus pantelleriae]|uniref:DUF2249 domain-containing protein n=1 Tax=Candidatus Methylacidithermus pantelleriae TaxID=2744239 RepID=UPI00157D7750